jgi:hypothetical protein
MPKVAPCSTALILWPESTRALLIVGCVGGDPGQQCLAGLVVRDGGPGDYYGQEEAEGVDDDAPLPPDDLLPVIRAPG